MNINVVLVIRVPFWVFVSAVTPARTSNYVTRLVIIGQKCFF